MARSKRSTFRRILLLLIVLILGGGAAVYFLRPEWIPFLRKNTAANEKKKADPDGMPDRIYTVIRSDMPIGVMLKGSVNAKKKHKLALEAPFPTKLVKVSDENAKVKSGDIVAEFETSDLQTKIDDLKLSIEQTKKDLSIAQEERTVLLSTNAAEIRSAKDNVTTAQDAYSQYFRLEGPKERDTKDLAVSDAKLALEEAEDALKTAEDTYNTTVYSSEEEERKAKQEIEKLEQKRDSAKTKLNSAELDRKLFKRYTHPNKIRELRNKLAQAKLNYEKTKVSTQSSLMQKDNRIYTYEISIRNNERQLELHQSWLPMMTLRAPTDGIITYGDPDRVWGNPEVKVGMDGRRRQVIITIPDMSQMIVDVSVPEQYRSKIAVGNRAIITPDSIREIKLEGEVSKIAVLPNNMIAWDRESPKVYRTVIEFTKSHPRIVSGMSVQVEVVTKVLKNVLSLPVEAVFEEGGELFVYRKKYGSPEKVKVTIGESGDNAVQILDGISEGDEIYLYRPYQSTEK